MTFKALLTEQTGEKSFQNQIVQRQEQDLPPGDVTIAVAYSSLNYKDALSASGHPGVTRHFPHTPGIDAVGEVLHSEAAGFQPGDKVIVTGRDLGMNTDGGLAEKIRVPASWVLPLPDGLSPYQAMALGTAGLTAGLCVDKLLRSGAGRGDTVLVTGASGGVGSIAVALLAKLGLEVTAMSGKSDFADTLQALGATAIIGRQELSEANRKPMLKPRWQFAVDCVGGDILANILKSLDHSGAVAICGLVASPQFEASVYPFILRGIDLLGVDSVEIPEAVKARIWQHYASDWNLDEALQTLSREIALEQAPAELEQILAGQSRGRVVVKL